MRVAGLGYGTPGQSGYAKNSQVKKYIVKNHKNREKLYDFDVDMGFFVSVVPVRTGRNSGSGRKLTFRSGSVKFGSATSLVTTCHPTD